MAGEGEETFFRLLGAAKRQNAGSSVWRDEALEQILGLDVSKRGWKLEAAAALKQERL